MKKTILFAFTCISALTYGQQVTTQTSEQKDQFTCQHIEVMPDNKIVLRENVRIDVENLHVEADSAVLDEKDQTLVTYGTKNFVFKGGEVVIRETAKNTIRYKLKDSILYVE